MRSDYYKYKIQRKETLEDISKKFKVSVEELRAFHNQYCSLDALIGGIKISRHIKEIYIRPELVYTEKDLSQIPQVITEKGLRRSTIKVNRTYGVIQKRFKNGIQQSQIHYQIKIGNDVAEDLPYNQVILKKQQTYLNEKEVEMNVEQLYQKLDRMLYPLQINLNKDGSFHSLANTQEIKQRWNRELRPKFIEYYAGELSEQVIKKLDNIFAKISVYEKEITGSLFYTFFFMPLYVEYEENNEYKQSLEVPFFPFKKKIKYDLVQKMDTELSPTQKIHIHVQGKCTEKQTVVEMEAGNRTALAKNQEGEAEKKGDLKFIYKLHARDKTIFSATGEINLTISPKENKKITLEIYELNNNY